jgi:hypothetical protein
MQERCIMKRLIILSLVVGGLCASRALVFADHDKACKNIHGKVTVVTDEGITVADKMYKVGKSTRITKNEKAVKLENITAGDLVCLDMRGKDDIGSGEVAAVAILTIGEPKKDKEYVRETVREVTHNKNCPHLHGKITRVEEATFTLDGKPYVTTTTTRITKDGQVDKIQSIKSGDFVCVDSANEKVTSVVVLSPTDATPFQTREREIIREKIRDEK